MIQPPLHDRPFMESPLFYGMDSLTKEIAKQLGVPHRPVQHVTTTSCVLAKFIAHRHLRKLDLGLIPINISDVAMVMSVHNDKAAWDIYHKELPRIFNTLLERDMRIRIEEFPPDRSLSGQALAVFTGVIKKGTFLNNGITSIPVKLPPGYERNKWKNRVEVVGPVRDESYVEVIHITLDRSEYIDEISHMTNQIMLSMPAVDGIGLYKRYRDMESGENSLFITDDYSITLPQEYVRNDESNADRPHKWPDVLRLIYEHVVENESGR